MNDYNKYTCEIFYKDLVKTDLLRKAIYENDIEKAKEEVNKLIEAGDNIDICNENGVTALMKASHYGHIEIVKLLIDKGADVNYTDVDGESLEYADSEKHLKVFKLLIKHGAKKNKKWIYNYLYQKNKGK